MSRYWADISPADATDLTCTIEGEIIGPFNEIGEMCPWPWEPQQLKNVPMGQYHCGFCGAMVMAGIPHIDYKDI